MCVCVCTMCLCVCAPVQGETLRERERGRGRKRGSEKKRVLFEDSVISPNVVKSARGVRGERALGVLLCLGPVRNPVLSHRVRLCSLVPLVWESNPNSRVAGARPNHQADRGSDPNHRGIWSPPMAGLGPVRNPVL